MLWAVYNRRSVRCNARTCKKKQAGFRWHSNRCLHPSSTLPKKETAVARKLLNPSELHPAPGFSHIAVAEPGRVAYIAGQVALAPDFSVIGGDDLGAQTKAAMRNIEVTLKALNASWDDVVRRTIYTLHPTEYEVITAAIEEVQGS